MRLLCIDIGGTSVKYGVFEHQSVSDVGAFTTPKSWDEMTQQLLKVYHTFHDIDGIAVSSPGSVDSIKGRVHGISAVPYIHHRDIVDALETLFNKPVSIENDANCAALAELHLGVAKHSDNTVFYILGTGIGGAISINKQLIKGRHLFGGEIGYMLLDETHNTSVLASPYNAGKRIGLSGKQLFDRAANGDDEAVKVRDDMLNALARSMYNVSVLLDPDMIVVGGAISQREDFIAPLHDKLTTYLHQQGASELIPTIKKCAFQQHANLVGAAMHFLTTK